MSRQRPALLGAAHGIFERIGATLDREICDKLLAQQGRQDLPRAAAQKAPIHRAEANLHREGDVWSIQFEGGTLRLKDGKVKDQVCP